MRERPAAAEETSRPTRHAPIHSIKSSRRARIYFPVCRIELHLVSLGIIVKCVLFSFFFVILWNFDNNDWMLVSCEICFKSGFYSTDCMHFISISNSGSEPNQYSLLTKGILYCWHESQFSSSIVGASWILRLIWSIILVKKNVWPLIL